MSASLGVRLIEVSLYLKTIIYAKCLETECVIDISEIVNSVAGVRAKRFVRLIATFCSTSDVLGLLILRSIHSVGIFPCAICNDHVFHFFKFRNGIASYVFLDSPLHSTDNFICKRTKRSLLRLTLTGCSPCPSR